MAAYAVYKTPGGLYKYLQAVTLYLTLPVAPAIVFGILSKKVTAAGAMASVLVGSVFGDVFVTHQLIGARAATRLFPWLHAEPLPPHSPYPSLSLTFAFLITFSLLHRFP